MSPDPFHGILVRLSFIYWRNVPGDFSDAVDDVGRSSTNQRHHARNHKGDQNGRQNGLPGDCGVVGESKRVGHGTSDATQQPKQRETAPNPIHKDGNHDGFGALRHSAQGHGKPPCHSEEISTGECRDHAASRPHHDGIESAHGLLGLFNGVR